MRPTHLLFLMASLSSGVAYAADAGKVYRWVDQAGHVHYSDQANSSAQELRKPAPSNSAADKTPAAEATDGDAHAQECQRKKEQLITYQHASKVTETDGLGNTREYSPAEKQKLIELNEKSIHDLCSPE